MSTNEILLIAGGIGSCISTLFIFGAIIFAALWLGKKFSELQNSSQQLIQNAINITATLHNITNSLDTSNQLLAQSQDVQNFNLPPLTGVRKSGPLTMSDIERIGA